MFIPRRSPQHATWMNRYSHNFQVCRNFKCVVILWALRPCQKLGPWDAAAGVWGTRQGTSEARVIAEPPFQPPQLSQHSRVGDGRTGGVDVEGGCPLHPALAHLRLFRCSPSQRSIDAGCAAFVVAAGLYGDLAAGWRPSLNISGMGVRHLVVLLLLILDPATEDRAVGLHVVLSC